MVSYVTNYIQDTATSYLKTGITAAGTMAGNAVGGVGTLVENSGRSIGQGAQGVTGGVGSVGSYINNYGNGVRDKFAADGPASGKKTAVKPGEGKKPPAPGGAPKGLPGGQGAAKKSLPAAGGAVKSLSGPERAAGSPRPPAQGRALPPKSAAAGGASKPSPQNFGKQTVSAASRPKMGAPGLKPPSSVEGSGPSKLPAPKSASSAPKSNPPRADGKVAISAASRPRMGAKGVKPAGR